MMDSYLTLQYPKDAIWKSIKGKSQKAFFLNVRTKLDKHIIYDFDII